MSSNQVKDQLHPMREELMKRREQEQKNEPTQHNTKRNDEDRKEEDSVAKQPSRPAAEEQEPTRYKWWDSNPGKEAENEPQSTHSQERAFTFQKNRLNEDSSQEDLQTKFAKHQTEQKMRDKAHEDFNTKYTEYNKQLSLHLKNEREEKQRMYNWMSSNEPSAPTDKGDVTTSHESANSDSMGIDILHSEILDFMSSTGMKLSNPFLPEKICDYITKRNFNCGHKLTAQGLKNVQQAVTEFFEVFTKKYHHKKVNRHLNRLLQDDWSQETLTMPKRFEKVPSHTESSLCDIPAETILKIMKENPNVAFTDTAKQSQAVKDYILSTLSLSEEDIAACKEELDYKIRMFVVQSGNKYLQAKRNFQRMIGRGFKSSSERKTSFVLPQSIIDKVREKNKNPIHGPEPVKRGSKMTVESQHTSQLPQNCPHHTSSNLNSNEPVDDYSNPIPVQRVPNIRQSLPFEEKSKRAQQYAAAQVRQGGQFAVGSTKTWT